MTSLPLHARVYTLTNARSGGLLDVSLSDRKTVITSSASSARSQQWIFTEADPSSNEFWVIRSQGATSPANLFLGFQDSPSDGTQLITQATSIQWQVIVDTKGNLKLIARGTPFEITASGAPPTPVVLRPSTTALEQSWMFKIVTEA